MKYVGQSIPRNDGFDKVTGRGLFTFDVNVPRMVYAKVLRSPYAHAKVLSIDTSEAEALPGVRAVCTFENTTNKVWNGAAPMFITPLPHKPVLTRPSSPMSPSTSAMRWLPWPPIPMPSPSRQ